MMEMFGYGRVWMMTIQSSSPSGKRRTPSHSRLVVCRLLLHLGCFTDSWCLIEHGSSQRWIETCSFLHRKASWWRQAPTTQCRSTRFLTAIQMASWPGSLPTPHMSPSTAVARESLPDPGTRDGRLTWKPLEGVSNYDQVWKHNLKQMKNLALSKGGKIRLLASLKLTNES